MVRPRLRRARAFGALLALSIAGLASPACIIADPPPELPPTPTQAPEIAVNSVVPPVGCVATWPSDHQFVIPIQLANPADSLEYVVFEDYLTPSSVDVEGTPPNAKAPEDGGSFLVHVFIPQPSDTQCHTFTLFAGLQPSTAGGTWQPTGGGTGIDCAPYCTSVEWTYNCGGCAAFDAGQLPDGAMVRGDGP